MKCPKCGTDTSTSPEEQAFLKEVKLDKMTEEKRIKYVNEVILSLAKATGKMQGKNLLEKKKLAERYAKDFSSRGEEIMGCILYAIKPEFRKAQLELLKAEQNITAEVILPR
jgi:hypothetical protein